ncbi:hypothetical protein [Mycobacterium asiaticum]|uniref:hypothetical protein n=1 Tax=Mycobacterium asiaticum TaxID=1790 RepID=UPI0007EF2CBA|nr:hypothetical protein [Mycobacterium asiaticum]OBI88709.1 hypothetical protein A5661_05230 [Mycobacterium asiaticum]
MHSPAPIAICLLIAGGIACPPAHADATYGPGTYTVPEQLPHGIYTARTDVRDPGAPECTFSTWTSDWKPITGDSVGPAQTITADVSAAQVGHFITHGCTPWTKVSE